MNDHLDPCACLGPMNGEPFCNCQMIQRNLPRSDDHKRKQAEAREAIKQIFSKPMESE